MDVCGTANERAFLRRQTEASLRVAIVHGFCLWADAAQLRLTYVVGAWAGRKCGADSAVFSLSRNCGAAKSLATSWLKADVCSEVRRFGCCYFCYRLCNLLAPFFYSSSFCTWCGIFRTTAWIVFGTR